MLYPSSPIWCGAKLFTLQLTKLHAVLYVSSLRVVREQSRSLDVSVVNGDLNLCWIVCCDVACGNTSCIMGGKSMYCHFSCIPCTA
jgi:hypothetical protein